LKPGTIAAVVLAAGRGTRMKSAQPKVMHPIAGRPMICHLLASVAELGAERVVVVLGPGMDPVAKAVAPASVAIQEQALGTGHAVLAARQALAGFKGDVLVLLGGDPLTSTATMQRLVEARRAAKAAVAVLGMQVRKPNAFGRLVVDKEGRLERIVEYRDATPAERAITLCNAGVMAFDAARIWELLDRIGNDNAKNEYYLTDAIGLARTAGHGVVAVESDDPDEPLKVDSRGELAAVEAVLQGRFRASAMENGATLIDPATVYFSYDTRLAPDVVVEPNVFFGPGVTVGEGARIRAFSHLEGAEVAARATVGPFARLRPGTRVGEGAKVGNFVEVKNAVLEKGAKANHLAYLGDARVGEGSNIGAGTITANYDGIATKSRTEIGAGVAIGSNTVLVAPVVIGDGAMVGAGSVITRDVAPDAIAVTRARQEEKPDGAKRFRERKARAKAAAAKDKTPEKTKTSQKGKDRSRREPVGSA
jgi:bifunctional UDP-N-acetylglucosamine pyrophosphorylase / glucosamine-1-phosphate N-acetyltransferase